MKFVIYQLLVSSTVNRQAPSLLCSPLVSVWAQSSSLLLTTCLPCMLSPGPLLAAVAAESCWRYFSTSSLHFSVDHRVCFFIKKTLDT